VGFEPTIAVLERAKTVRALERSATAIGKRRIKVSFPYLKLNHGFSVVQPVGWSVYRLIQIQMSDYI
jgi:hypothetical protein